MTKLNYFDYNINSFGLIGDDEKKLGKHIRSLGGRWNNRMKGGSGWLVPRDREDDLIKLIKESNMDVEKTESIVKSNKKIEIDNDLETFFRIYSQYARIYIL